MKKTYLKMLAIVSLLASASAYGQGTIWLNNYDPGFGVYKLTGAVSGPAPVGTFIELIGGATAGSMTGVQAPGSGNSVIFTVTDPQGSTGSYFDNGYGVAQGVPVSSSGFFQLLVWSGAATYAQALTTSGAFAGQSTVWQQLTGTNPGGNVTPVPVSMALPGAVTMSIVATPEPGTLALAGLGAAALLVFRRRK